MPNLATLAHPGPCVSNLYGACGACLSSPKVREAGKVGGAVLALVARRRLVADRAALAALLADVVEWADVLALDGVARPARRVLALVPGAETRKRLAELTREAAKYAAQVDTAREAIARREAHRAEVAERERKRKRAALSEHAARAGSMALEWTVVIRFARGARDVKVCKVGEVPGHYEESRAASKAREGGPGLRYSEAVQIADTIRERIPQRTTRRVGRRRRR